MDDHLATAEGNEQENDDEISSELIHEIADKVYVLLIRRLQIEHERDRQGISNDWGW